MNWKNGLLAASILVNAVLVTYLVTGHGPDVMTSPAFAQNRVVAGGGFAATTARVTSSRQALWIVDNTEKRLIVYAFPSARGKNVEPIGARDLRRDFKDLSGEVMILPGEIPGGSEAVYVIDPVGKKMIAYESRGSNVEAIGNRDLSEDFRAGTK